MANRYILMGLQSGDIFDSSNLYMMNWTKGNMIKNLKFSADKSIYGDAFHDLARNTDYSLSNTITVQLDSTMFFFLNYIVPDSKTTPYLFSVAYVYGDYQYRFTSVGVSDCKISGSVSSMFTVEMNLVAAEVELLSNSSNPLTYTSIADVYNFHQASILFGDIADALDSNDNLQVQDFTLSINNNYAEVSDNTGVIIPVYAGCTISGSFSAVMTDESFLLWEEEDTILQCQITVEDYDIRIPVIRLTKQIKEEGRNTIQINFMAGQNGRSSYINDNMQTSKPIEIRDNNLDYYYQDVIYTKAEGADDDWISTTDINDLDLANNI